jgi:hypothetical protein
MAINDDDITSEPASLPGGAAEGSSRGQSFDRPVIACPPVADPVV